MKAFHFILFGTVLLATQCANKESKIVTTETTSENWEVLFDGSTVDKWRDAKMTIFPEEGWKVEGEVLSVLGETDVQPGGHDIITKERYENFELHLEVLLSEGANSGIKYLVSNDFPEHEGKFLGLEYQLLDNERHPDALNGRDGNHKMAALYDMIAPPEELQINPPGQWNKVKILLDGDTIEHWLNGQKVLTVDRSSLAFRELVSISKYSNLEKFGELSDGHILLQGHGNDVSFRNIKIRTW